MKFAYVTMALALGSCATAPSYSGCSISLDGPVDAEFRAATMCVLSQARELEPSGEPAEAIGRAAVQRCTGPIVAYEQAVERSGCVAPDSARRLNASTRLTLADRAATEVIVVRSR